MVSGKGNGAEIPDAAGGETPFGRALDDLEASGSGFLVAGGVPEAVHEAACRQFLGSESPHPRGQVVVTTSGDRLVEGSSGGPADRRRVVEFATELRSTDVAGSASPASRPGQTTTATGLADLGTETLSAIEAVAPPDGFDPGDLRLCFDAFGATVDQYGEQALFEFVHLLLARVRARNGLLHAHFRGDRGTTTANLFEPLFDGVVELRINGDTAEQRWHLREADVSSGWLPLDG